MKKQFLVGGVIFLMALAGISFFFFQETESFSIHPDSLNVNMVLNSETQKQLTITNNKEELDIYLKGLEDIGFLKEGLDINQIEIDFKSKNISDVHVGFLVVGGLESTKKIPIVLNIKNSDNLFSINQDILPNYREHYPGGEFGMKIEIFDLGISDLREINIKYLIKSMEEEVVYEEEESRTIKESEDFEKIVSIPENLVYGDYVFITMIDYKGIKSTSSYLFSISEKEKDFNMEFLIYGVLGFFVIMFFLFFYFLKTRDELLVQLKRQQKQELDRGMQSIQKSRQRIKQIKNSVERKRKLGRFKKVRRNIIKKIKKKHKTQRKIVKRLEKQKKKSEVKNKLEQWKKQGYNVNELLIKGKKESVKKLTNQGYRF